MDTSLKNLLKTLWIKLNAIRKKQLLLIIALGFFASIIETISVGSIYPMLNALMGQQSSVRFLVEIQNYINVNEPDNKILLVLFFAVMTIAGAGLKLVLLWAQSYVSQSIGADISVEMYNAAIRRPYIKIISQNTSELVSGITTKSAVIVHGIVFPIVNTLSAGLMILLIVLTIGYISPFATFFTFILAGGIYFILQLVFKERLRTNGIKISKGYDRTIKILQEGFGSVRDLILAQSYDKYVEKYKKVDFPLRMVHVDNFMIGSSPRHILESIMLLMLVLVGYSMADSENERINSLAVLGTLALGIQRILPMLQQCYSNITTLRASQGALSDGLSIIQSMHKIDNGSDTDVAFNFEIKIENLMFRYPTKKSVSLEVSSLTITKGSVVGIIGKSGGGKSTLLDLIMGLLLPMENNVTIDGIPLSDRNCYNWYKKITHVPQQIFLADASIEENVALGDNPDDIDQIKLNRAIEIADLVEFIETLDEKLKTKIGENGAFLSGGQRQRIGIARAIYKMSEVIVFDEATSALDNYSEMKIISRVMKEFPQKTVLIVTHRESLLSFCDKVYEVSGGLLREYV